MIITSCILIFIFYQSIKIRHRLQRSFITSKLCLFTKHRRSKSSNSCIDDWSMIRFFTPFKFCKLLKRTKVPPVHFEVGQLTAIKSTVQVSIEFRNARELPAPPEVSSDRLMFACEHVGCRRRVVPSARNGAGSHCTFGRGSGYMHFIQFTQCNGPNPVLPRAPSGRR